jgi:hypothetical protein
VTDEHGASDPFGRTVGERLWRRIAGASVAVAACAVPVVLWSTELLPWVTFGAVVVLGLGVPASWLVTRRGWPPVRSHLLAGAGVGAFVALVLAQLSGGLAWFPVFGVAAVGFGLLVAGLATAVGLRLPWPWVRPVGVAGLGVAVVLLPFATWLVTRQPAPHDHIVLSATPEVLERFGDAVGLANAVAAGFEQEAAAGQPRLAHETWVQVGTTITDLDLGDSEPWLRFTTDDELPSQPATGEPVRLVTAIVRGQPVRACVIVAAAGTTVEPRACDEVERAAS